MSDRAYAAFAPPPGRAAIVPGLDRMRGMLERLGRPERRLPPTVHVAGTNGKGSTVAFLRAFFEAGGKRAHAFTSPHLSNVRECVRLARAPGASALIDDARLAQAFACVEAAADGALRPTPFEALTLAALLVFAETPADVLLLETGMGGREDATNVVETLAAAVITTISHDHMEFLGPTLLDVAGHKAGVAKPGAPLVIAPQFSPAVMSVFERASARIGAPLSIGGRDWLAYADGDGMTYVSACGVRALPAPALSGPHQIFNAGAAIATLEAAFPALANTEIIAEGLRRADWPGRLQSIPRGGRMRVWADGGHNESAALALAAWATAEDPEAPISLIVGMLANKDVDAFLEPLVPLVDQLVAVPVRHAPRPAHSADRVATAAQSLGLTRVTTAESVEAALSALAAAGSGRALICGSLYLLPELAPSGVLGPEA